MSQPEDKNYYTILICLVIFGAVLRFYNLGFNSLWLDEATTYEFAKSSFLGIWQITASGEFNPPLFTWLEHIMLMFGNSEVVLRFLPAVFGVLMIPVSYLVGKEFMNSSVGVITAGLVAFSPFLILYSQEARAYSLSLFLVSVAMLFWFRGLRLGNVNDWILFGVFSALAFWTHMYTVVILFTLVLYTLLIRYGKIKLLGYSIITFTILSLPLLTLLPKLFFSRVGVVAMTFGLQGPLLIFATLFQLSGFNIFSFVAMTFLFGVGVLYTIFFDKEKGAFLILATVVMFSVGIVFSYFMPMVPRYFTTFSIIFFLGIASSCQLFLATINIRNVVPISLTIAILVGVPFLPTYYSEYTKDDWRGTADVLRQDAQPGDLIVLLPGYLSQPLNYYYSNVTQGTIEVQAYTFQDIKKAYDQRGNSTVYFIRTGDYLLNDGSDEWMDGVVGSVAKRYGIVIYKSH